MFIWNHLKSQPSRNNAWKGKMLNMFWLGARIKITNTIKQNNHYYPVSDGRTEGRVQSNTHFCLTLVVAVNLMTSHEKSIIFHAQCMMYKTRFSPQLLIGNQIWIIDKLINWLKKHHLNLCLMTSWGFNSPVHKTMMKTWQSVYQSFHFPLQWLHNMCHSVSNHQPHDS